LNPPCSSRLLTSTSPLPLFAQLVRFV
jgi:hypothetical protein